MELLTDATEKPYWNKEGKKFRELLKNSRLLEKSLVNLQIWKSWRKKKNFIHAQILIDLLFDRTTLFNIQIKVINILL